MSVNRIKNIDEIVTQNSGSGSQTMQVIPTNISNPANDDVLIFNGTEWTNTPKSAIQGTEIHYLLVGGGGSSSINGGGGAGGMITSWPSDKSGGNTPPRPALKVPAGHELIVTVGGSNTSSTVTTTYDDFIENENAGLVLLVGLRGGHANSGHNVGGSAGGKQGSSTYAFVNPKIIHRDGLAQGMKGSSGFPPGGGGGAGANAGLFSKSPGGNGLPSALGTAAGVGDVHTDGLSYFAGGGAGKNYTSRSLGGGGRAFSYNGGVNTEGLPNTGGGGGCGDNATWASAPGGSGICILAVETASYSGITTGSPTIQQVTLDSKSYTLVIFLGDGSYTV